MNEMLCKIWQVKIGRNEDPNAVIVESQPIKTTEKGLKECDEVKKVKVCLADREFIGSYVV